MTVLKIAQIGHPILRRKAKEVGEDELKSKELQQLIDEMIETLKEEGGVGLAAPQVFSLKRIIILRSIPTKESFRKVRIPLTVIINPKIIYQSKQLELDWEGCLSVFNGNLRGLVPRSYEVKVKGLNRKGEEIIIKAKSFKARVIQHEIDHLEGILFLERVRKKDFRYLSSQKEWVKFHKPKWSKPIII